MAVVGALYLDEFISNQQLDGIYVNRASFVWPQILAQQEDMAEDDPARQATVLLRWTSANLAAVPGSEGLAWPVTAR